MKGKLKTIVCGTRFGENYISALLEEDTGFELSGILARGSGRSRAIAADFGIPLFTRPDDLPGNIDLACVVLRGTAFGGPGTEIAEALLRRGINVIQEHPVHPAEIRRLHSAARSQGRQYQVNCFYGHSEAARSFIRFVTEWRSVRSPHYVTVTTAPQLLYSTLDLLGRAFGGLEDFDIAGKTEWPSDIRAEMGSAVPPFETLHGRIGRVPLILNLQAYIDPRDPDHHSLVMHNIAVGGPEGRVELVNSFGPVVWSHAIYVPDYDRDDARASYLTDWASKAEHHRMTLPTALTLGPPDGPSLAEAGRRLFPEMILGALSEMQEALENDGVAPATQHPDYLEALASAWQRCMHAVGPLAERELSPPPEPTPDPRAFAAAIAEEGRNHG